MWMRRVPCVRMMPTLWFNILLVVNLPPPERGKGTAKRYQQAKKTEETEEACRTEGLNIKKSLRFFGNMGTYLLADIDKE